MAESHSASPSLDLAAKALDLLRAGAFPEWWVFVPVAGKETYVEEWTTKPLTRERLIETYKTNFAYRGLGVCTGEFSGGLIALDIDGERADARFRGVSGDEYDTFGQERTMAWTSGKPGRRQLLYRVPASVIPELRHVKTVILREGDGEWHLGQGDTNRGAGGAKTASGDKPYEEVVLRFNACQSVVPGSPHPDGGRYRWLNYNDGQVPLAPAWVMEVLRQFRKPVQWLSDADQKALDAELGETAIPSRQIRGWFFKDEVQRLLMPRLDELVFRHETFDKYGWKTREGSNPQRMSGCPWHGGQSGTSFQYSLSSGCWDCKACGIGGDVLDFVHKIRSDDMHATRPQGPDLEVYVAEIATALGFDYPACAKAVEVTTKEAPLRRMSSVEFHEELGRIYDAERNPAVRMDRMALLAAETGRRMSGKDCESALGEYRYKKAADEQNRANAWFDEVEAQHFIIPNFLVRPGQVILHAEGGVGKTSACLGLAKAIGTGTPMKVRGIEVPVVQGPVLWVQSDQTLAKLKRDLQDNDIDPVRKDRWFHLRRGFQINHMREFAGWVREIKPALVVVDSIGSCSSRMQVKEIEAAFATPLYWYNEANGSPAEDGFPACTIIWIHHDNANGQVRGNRYLVNAVDEQWHLRRLTDEEKDKIREKGESPSAVRLIQIKKSRAGREGDLFKVIRDENFAYHVEDYTPTVRREDGGQGDPEPVTMVLEIVKQACQAEEVVGQTPSGMTREAVWRELVDRLRGLKGEKAKMPTQRTVERWMNRWVEDGMLEKGKKVTHSKGRPSVVYRLPSSRAWTDLSVSKKENARDPLQGNGSFFDKGEACRKIEPPEGGPEEGAGVFDTAAPGQVDVEKSNPVVASDLSHFYFSTSPSRGKEAPEDGPPAPGETTITNEETIHAEAQREDCQLGAEVPGGEDDAGSVLGGSQPVAPGGGRAPDHSDVPEPAPAQAGEPQGVVGAGARPEWVIPEDAWETGFDVLGGGSC